MRRALQARSRPFQNISRTSGIDDFDRIVKTDGIDTVVGSALSYNYGVNSRLRQAQDRHAQPGTGDLTVTLSSYFPPTSGQRNATGNTRRAPPDRRRATFSPIFLGVRVNPTRDGSAHERRVRRSKYKSCERSRRAAATPGPAVCRRRRHGARGKLIQGLQGFDNPDYLDHYLSGAVNAHTRDNRFGGLYSFNYNILHSKLLQQRLTGFYNAQCCGVAFDYQR